ncbi:enoyl-CoA hydratase/isomerase family protein [Nocardioides ochotonae]|uniref:enoyl-CoA hydratase/isomerase family protein n=1 Tax=Nocardioides ochotonae TaxID=2685869 RepID=UPI00140997D2|nr:enoyl-CoA hydratase/isomerase family protein [Nocardioides ochotonae]
MPELDLLQVLDLDSAGVNWADEAAVGRFAAGLRQCLAPGPHGPGAVGVVGVASRPLPRSAGPVLEQLTVTLAQGPAPWCAGSRADLPSVLATADRAPGATRVLLELLRTGGCADVGHGLLVESLAYSMLLAGPEFRCWRASTPAAPPVEVEQPVLLSRRGARLEVVLNRPERHNAWGRQVRDGFLAGLELAELDPALTEVVVRGAGPSYCSGGDLDEFGTAPNVVSAHAVRLARSGAMAVTRLRERLGPGLRFELHGLCIGAGIEIPAAAGRVVANPDTRFRLPELSLGLVPGAGGTVTLPRRIGRWRTAWMALTGADVDAGTAREWGLVDEVR